MARQKDKGYFRLKTCKVCKKEFMPAPMHQYIYKNQYCCSYTCFRKLEKRDTTKKNRSIV